MTDRFLLKNKMISHLYKLPIWQTFILSCYRGEKGDIFKCHISLCQKETYTIRTIYLEELGSFPMFAKMVWCFV